MKREGGEERVGGSEIGEGKGIRFTARSPGSQPASQPPWHSLGFPLRHYPLLSLPSPRVLSAPLISPPSLALPAFTHTSRKGRSSCVKLVAKRADERACMRIFFFFIRGNVGIGESGGRRRRRIREGRGRRGGKNEEGKRGQQRLSLARGEAETRSRFQYAAESREFSLDLMMKIRTVVRFSTVTPRRR